MRAGAIFMGSVTRITVLAACVSMFLPIFCAPCAADAAMTLFRLGGLSQTLDLEYEFQQQKNQGGGGQDLSAASQHVNERYGASFQYALISPDVVKGRFSAGADLTQDESESSRMSRSSSNSNKFDYNLSGQAFRKTWHPVSFFDYTQFSRVQQAFSPSYDLKSEGFGGSASLNNTFLPISLNYSNRKLTSSGAGTDTENSTESITFSASHGYREISQSSMSLSLAKSDTTTSGVATTNSRTTTGLFKNLLNFGHDDLNRGIDSTVVYERENGTSDNRSLELSEMLNWDMNRQLKGYALYRHRDRRTGGMDMVENSGVGWLRYRLFDSLTTQLGGRGSRTDYNYGSIRETGGTMSIDYQKKLPADSQLMVGLGYDYAEFDNALSDDILTTVNEHYTVGNLPPYEFTLDKPDVITASITVRNKERTITYTVGRDYTITVDGRQTRIVLPNVPTSGPVPISAGSILSIDYQYRVNPAIRYSQTSYFGSAVLSLLKSRYRLYLRGNSTSQKVLENRGGASAGLADVMSYAAGGEAHGAYVTYGGSYQRTASSVNQGQSFDGFWRYSRNFGGHDLRINLRDHYSLQDMGATNTLSVIGDYNTILMGWSMLHLQGRYQMLSGRSSSNEVGGSADLSVRFRRMEVSVGTEASWRFSQGATSSDMLFRVRLSRSF